MVPAPQRRSSRLAPPPDQGASSEPPPSRKRKPTTADTSTLATTTAPKKQRANEPVSVLETHTTASIVKSTRKGMPAPTRRSARTAIHDDEDCIVRETDDDDGDIKSDTDIVSASGDDNDAPSSSTAPAVRRRASRVKKEAEEQVAPVPLTRRNQPKRGVGGGALPVEPKVEHTFEKTKQPRPRPSKHQVIDDNDSSDFVKDDVKTLRPPPFQASTSSSIPRLTADGGDIMSDDNRPEAAKLGKQGRAKRVVRAIPVRQAPTTLKPLSKNAQGKRKAAAVGARRPSKQLQDSSDGGDSSEFVASSSSDEGSGDDDDVADWASTLKSKAARGKDLVDGSSSSSYDDNAPIKSIKRPKTGRSPKKPAAAAALTEHAQGNDGGDGRDGGVVRRAEPIEYPYYEVAYAPTGRARCKTCEKTLVRGELVVSIRLRHSRFGIMAYHKHIECTLLNNDVAKPLHGFDALDRDDVDRVQAYMVTNSKLGVEDERVALGDEAFIKRDILPAGTPSPHLTASLLPYQQEGLAWMKAQEASKYRGGILADEMGMGKTIQAIATMLENVKIKQFEGMVMGGGTLIICPVIACMQWKSEIERFVEANHLSILLYHGPKRTNLTAELASYDVVLTTYSILENEGRKLMEAEKVACAYCHKLFVPEKLVPHNKYFCGPDSRKTSKQMKQQKGKPTKAAVAARAKAKTLSDQDSSSKEEEEEHDAPIKPPPRKSNRRAKKGRSPLHEVEWTRIILDEAHYIKDKKCSTARSVFRLKSQYKWCLSGTPLQNRIGELFSLVRFLQVDPQAYYECAECDCKQLDFSIFHGHCKHCDHTAMQHYSFFNKKIVTPIQGFGYVAEGKLAMLRLQNDLLRHVLLRRTKESRADDISLPPKLVRVRRDALDEREKDFYESIYTQSKAQFNTYVSAGTLLNNYAHIFDLLIRLRQAVDHPYLVIYSKSNPALQVPTPDVPARDDLALIGPPPSSSADDPDDGRTCGFCHEPPEQAVKSACHHLFCHSCVEEYVESLLMGAQATCPTCNEPLTVDMAATGTAADSDDDETHHVDQFKARQIGKGSLLRRLPHLGDFQSSTKIEALMEELHLMQHHDPSAKAIVFSQFVNMLDLIEHRLRLAGLKCVKLSGGIPMAQRDRLLTEFRDDPTLTVFLISLKAGGVALNLTVASQYVHIRLGSCILELATGPFRWDFGSGRQIIRESIGV
ncbi:hypothetical protein, variant 1 [Aphanomyces astaci]|uniref:RING-type domain-containing protein n=1 Tax=Aphanomyces astaci TaxID=112090 RepID=W4FXH8_APHAT|nr:hypothetical protein, variant 1 [Aphanomyces astaci]ETV71646.1 hypothetical protein, variant 1 [Aphanomyces astaci]|eukprot:XP_009838837.1 hypothetical protein, variant 1 [Aphanomyces astaci]